jgi:anti-anti-sigma regulatory factor
MVDMRDLSFADMTLILDLATLSHRLRRRGRRLLLQAPQPQIMQLIEIAGLDRLPGVEMVADGWAAPAVA